MIGCSMCKQEVADMMILFRTCASKCRIKLTTQRKTSMSVHPISSRSWELRVHGHFRWDFNVHVAKIFWNLQQGTKFSWNKCDKIIVGFTVSRVYVPTWRHSYMHFDFSWYGDWDQVFDKETWKCNLSPVVHKSWLWYPPLSWVCKS
jgi:hypothetical protein